MGSGQWAVGTGAGVLSESLAGPAHQLSGDPRGSPAARGGGPLDGQWIVDTASTVVETGNGRKGRLRRGFGGGPEAVHWTREDGQAVRLPWRPVLVS